ncbi:hypothetical protein DV735_g4370, partial [Chaetothyriales sp. CBS 134920]
MASQNPSLSAELFQAIRGSHVQLNRLITARLPLCLPPHTANPFLYASGMTVFAHLYAAIETAMDELVPSSAAAATSTTPTDPRVTKMLRTLHTSGLARSDRLGQDLDETIQQYRTDLHALLLARPHLILAWSWNMYLGIFNGGRFIRQTLRDAGPDEKKENQTQTQLRFWEFDGYMDGDDIKDEFKLNLEAASELLTAAEREEVVHEVGRVMDVCQEIVVRLDELVK